MSKKSFLVVAIVVAVALFSGLNINQSKKNEVALSDVALANVEALASENDSLYEALNCYLYGCQPDFNYNCHVYFLGSYLHTCSFHRG
ncbi:MAG: NVEALA domain-containing protein [Tannerella sp.]|jgi:outer membrane murein-binding lipoprotein Lpp|nr:NVEALA domain-containing protein [Tannerella sp.]